jgi:DNA mismatch endonuclease (patch repair protein)
LPGSPDIVFPRAKIAIFCDSDFWHGKSLENKKKTFKNNKEYWIKKIQDNIKRDKRNNKELKIIGWRVLRFWETDINNNFDKVINQVLRKLR